MNLTEGTRRLALFLGVIGLAFGGFVSYLQLQSTMHRSAEHQQFKQAAARLEKLGTKTQEAYPIYKGIDPGDLGWKVLKKYPRFGPWVSGQITHQPELPKPWENYQATQQSGSSLTGHYDWRNLGIEIPNGQTLYPTPAPDAWSYLLVAILPVLGFFIPWCAIRAIGWVVAGYAQPLN